jgi:hypothetical protein
MRILNAVEQYDFDSPPVFNSLQRKKYFDFSDTVHRIAQGLRSPTHQLGFLVCCGYFQATKKFFPSKDFHSRDVEYLAGKLGLSTELIELDDYNDRTRQKHQQSILKFYGYRAFDDVAKAFIRAEIDTMVRSQLKPRLIFWRCVDLLIREKVQLPGCFTLTDLITAAINQRKETLSGILKQQLSDELREQLEALFVQTPVEGEQQPGPTSAYRLTLLKKLSQSTKPSKIKERVVDFLLIEGLYQQFQPVLDALDLTHEGIRYYAHSVLKSEIFQVARRSDEDRYLHVVAFIAHQYYRLQDNLVDVLLTSIQSYQNTAQREHKEQRYAQRSERNQIVKTLLSYIDENLLSLVSAIQAITQDETLSDAEKIERINVLLPGYNDPSLALLRGKLATELGNDDYHRILEDRSIRLQNRVSPILKVLEFQSEPSAKPLLAALQYFKDKDGHIDKTAPMTFLTDEEADAVLAGDRFRVSLYKAFLFLHVQNGIKSGTLNLHHSHLSQVKQNQTLSSRRLRNPKPSDWPQESVFSAIA